MMYNEIPGNLLNLVCERLGKMPFKVKGIYINKELIKATLEILNTEPTKVLPQNCRNDIRERSIDGLDKRIKEALDSDLRTANLVSDVLEKAGIVKVVLVENPRTGRLIKATRLLEEWTW